MKFITCWIMCISLVGCEACTRRQDAEAASVAWGKAMGMENPGVSCDDSLPYWCAVSDRAGHIYSLRCTGSAETMTCTLRDHNGR